MVATYTVWKTLLTAAPPSPGFLVINNSAQYVAFVDARDGSGVLQPGALVEISLGDGDDDFIPLSLGDSLVNRTGGKVRLKWAAQSGITTSLLIAGDASLINYKANPGAALVVGDLGDALTNAAVAPGNAPGGTLLLAANANRRRVTLVNDGGVTVYLGKNGITAAAGYPLIPGDTFSTSDFLGALYGITASGTGAIRVFEEYKA